MIWFTSDTHFGHANIIKYCHRPFKDVKEMDDCLIENWNSVVHPNDEVWHLGDFCFGYKVGWYLNNLKGRIHIVFGNHDKEARQARHLFASYQDYRELKVTLGGDLKTIILSHYPMRSWNKCHHGSYHLFGHEHGNLSSWGRSFDVGVDCHNYRPISLDEVAAKIKTLETDPNNICNASHHGKVEL